MRRSLYAAGAAALLLASAWSARSESHAIASASVGDTVAYRAATIYTGGVPDRVENAYLVVRDGKIVAIAAEAPTDAKVVDLGSAVLVPGLIAADSTVSGESSNASGDLQTIGLHLRAIDGFDFYAPHEDLLSAGITTVYVAPGRNRLIGGRGAVVKLAGANRDARVLRKDSDVYVNLSSDVLNPPGIFTPTVPPTADEPLMPEVQQGPHSTPGIALVLRRLFADAERYRVAREKKDQAEVPFDPTLEAVLAIAKNDVRLVGRSASEISRALSLQREFFVSGERRVVLYGAVESARMAERLAGSKLPVILEMESFLGRFAPDIKEGTNELSFDSNTAARLDAAGVLFALAPANGTSLSQLRMLAARAMVGGLSETRALQSITANAAQILGVADRVGTLAVGRDADFVALNAAPFATGSHVLATYVNGERMWTRQERGTKLQDALVLRAGRLLDGRGNTVLDAEVLIIDGRIAEVGSHVARPLGARTIDYGPNATLTPGFIDGRSVFGFAQDQATYGPADDLALHRDPQVVGGHELALGGVTTVVSSPNRLNSKGTPMIALKSITREGHADEAVVRTLVGLRFEVQGPNRQRNLDSLASTLKRGKAYHEAWTQYETDYAKWKAENAGKPAEAPAAAKAEEKKEPEKSSEPKKDEPKKDDEKPKPEEEKPPKPDLLSGIWVGEAEKVPGVGTMPFTMTIEFDGEVASGIMRPQVKLIPPVLFEKGKFDGKTFTVAFVFENIHVELTADIADEQMKGVVKGPSGMEALITAKRVERPEARVRPVYRPRVEAKTAEVEEKGAPKKPKLEEDLECFRRVFRGELAIVVDSNRRDEIEGVIRIVMEEYGVSLVLLDPMEYRHAWNAIEKHRPGVLLNALIVNRIDDELHVPSAEMARAGLRVGFQSNSTSGGRSLREVAMWAVHHGLSPEQALQSLTSWPAEMLHIADRVGSLSRGCDADILVFSGEPFALGTELRTVYSRGRQVEKAERRWQ